MKALVLLLSLFTIFSCESSDQNENDFQTLEIVPTEIRKYWLKGIGAEGISESNMVITNISDWESLMEQMDSVINVTDSFEETDINFSSFIVLAIFDEVRPHSNFTITIDNIIEESDVITVNYIKNSGENGFAWIIQPFHIVKIPITDKAIFFEEEL